MDLLTLPSRWAIMPAVQPGKLQLPDLQQGFAVALHLDPDQAVTMRATLLHFLRFIIHVIGAIVFHASPMRFANIPSRYR